MQNKASDIRYSKKKEINLSPIGNSQCFLRSAMAYLKIEKKRENMGFMAYNALFRAAKLQNA